MTQTDPLAQRHGPLTAQVWDQISLARSAAQKDLPPEKLAFWLRRIRRLRRQILKARDSEPATQAVDDWFHPVIVTLSRAEAHFDAHRTGPNEKRRRCIPAATAQHSVLSTD